MKGFFLFFAQQKISKRYPWKTEFPAHTTSRKRSANQQKQSHNNAFHVKTSQSAKNQLNPAKNKNRRKMLCIPFLSYFYKKYLLVGASSMLRVNG